MLVSEIRRFALAMSDGHAPLRAGWPERRGYAVTATFAGQMIRARSRAPT